MKVENPLLSRLAHGTLASTIIYRRTPRGHAAYLHFKPKQPMTDAQKNHHELFHLLADRWNYLEAADRDYWLPIAEDEHMTTYNAYMQYNLERLNPAQPANLIGWWPNLIPAGDVLHDLTAAHNDGEFVSLNPDTAWALSLERRGRVIEYDGTGYVNVPDPPSTTGNYTWAFWFKQNAYTPLSAIVDTGYIARYTHARFGSQRAYHVLRNTFAPSPQMFLDNFTWHHYAGTWEQTTMQLYIDGAFASAAGQVVPLLPQVYMRFGIHNVGVAPVGFNGQVDDLRFYNRQLVLADIQELAAR